MILPTTYLATLLLLVFSALCWGSWANAQKRSGAWRFELFCYDFALGVAVCAIIAAFTFGSVNTQDLTFQDNFLLAGYRRMAWAAGAGIVFNLGNMLLAASISVIGMAAAFPIGLGLALIEGVVLNYAVNGTGGNAMLLIAGAVLVLLAIVIVAFASMAREDAQQAAKKPAAPGARVPKTRKGASAGAGIALGLASGIFMGAFYPMVDLSRLEGDGVAPYGLALLFAGGLLFSTLLYGPFFLNFPVQGEPLEFKYYFKGTKGQHFLGFLAGLVWMAGTIAYLTTASAPTSFQLGSTLAYTVLQGAALVGALWGLLVWREFKETHERTKMLMAAMLVLLLAGMGTIAIAPFYTR